MANWRLSLSRPLWPTRRSAHTVRSFRSGCVYWALVFSFEVIIWFIEKGSLFVCLSDLFPFEVLREKPIQIGWLAKLSRQAGKSAR